MALHDFYTAGAGGPGWVPLPPGPAHPPLSHPQIKNRISVSIGKEWRGRRGSVSAARGGERGLATISFWFLALAGAGGVGGGFLAWFPLVCFWIASTVQSQGEAELGEEGAGAGPGLGRCLGESREEGGDEGRGTLLCPPSCPCSWQGSPRGTAPLRGAGRRV